LGQIKIKTAFPLNWPPCNCNRVCVSCVCGCGGAASVARTLDWQAQVA